MRCVVVAAVTKRPQLSPSQMAQEKPTYRFLFVGTLCYALQKVAFQCSMDEGETPRRLHVLASTMPDSH
jgi:hypothetical protein